MKKLLFVISQLYKGGAETALVNLLNKLDYSNYCVDLLILNQCPVENAVSLVSNISNNVKICNAYAEYQKITVFDRIKAKIMYTMVQKGAYYFTALDFVKNKEYDWAFFVGEWCSPSFVAYEVKAKIKAVWIHSDISEAEYFDAAHYFYFYDLFDYFIFVSKNSLKSSVKAYPFIKDKSVTIYNISDTVNIKNNSLAPVQDIKNIKRPVLLTCANFRQEKNHLRQVQAMAELKRRGIEFTWVNIGATADTYLVSQVKEECRKYGLEENFLILGPQSNPYCYMRTADAVTVLSDHESWSMVISEAKILGKPVIATKTSGATEQLIDNETGILADFSVSNIADRIEAFITNKNLQEHIKKNIKNFDNTTEILNSFYNLIETGHPYKEEKTSKPKILYVIDDINYLGGAHIATKLQINRFVEAGKDISIFSSAVPNIKIRKELIGVKFYTFRDFKEDQLFNRRLCDCLTDPSLSGEEKKRKWNYTQKARRNRAFNYDEAVLPYLSTLFSQFDTICVMSEGSSYRQAVAVSSCKRKIQWIHTDYCDWKDKNDWSKKITKNDGELYKQFDKIVVLSDNIRDKFLILYPHLENKVIVNKNLIPTAEIKKKSLVTAKKNPVTINFITVGRIDYSKAYPRLIEILETLKKEGYNFTWKIAGSGNDYDYINNLIREKGMEKEVVMTGTLDNPFIEVKKADVFALLSDFEGIPNTIYEALVLGVPVLATNVGGISSQIINNQTGWLVPNDKKAIIEKLRELLMHPEDIDKIKNNLKTYVYDNEQVMEINNRIFDF
ncbi:glycosyltransferase involved in cell wall biosynthesis [Hungatella effluvii]|uniref:Glycosyltransferase involved in cell wall biosynthesis n=1 Tax=Hungatella effluvii TaxID=1096246 RepID=A0A2V3XX90_9FIRM|nr:glycosyltransferase [Hungatella effluvii]PXX48950.1 glycosyltransferase involved in cell wall biosynthesis [Hungatella effluvii]